MIAGGGEVQLFEREVRGLQAIVMTRDAVLIEKRALFGGV
jgi:hypothetical protein